MSLLERSISTGKAAANELLFTRRRPIPAIVVVDGVLHRLHLGSPPAVGETLVLGFPATVTETKHVAGGGVLIRAHRRKY